MIEWAIACVSSVLTENTIPSYFHSHLIYAEQKWKNHAYYAVSVIFELLLCTVEKLHTSWITHSPFILFKTQWGFEADKNREMWWYLSIREATLSCMLILTHTHTLQALLLRNNGPSVKSSPWQCASGWSGTDTESLASVSPMVPYVWRPVSNMPSVYGHAAGLERSGGPTPGTL